MLYFFVALFFVAVIGSSFLLSLMGWKRLANSSDYEIPSFNEEKIKIRFNVFLLNGIQYSSSISAIIGKKGIILRPAFFLRPSHSDIFIPWSDISFDEDFFAIKELHSFNINGMVAKVRRQDWTILKQAKM